MRIRDPRNFIPPYLNITLSGIYPRGGPVAVSDPSAEAACSCARRRRAGMGSRGNAGGAGSRVGRGMRGMRRKLGMGMGF